MSKVEIVPPKDCHEIYVWVIDYAGDGQNAYGMTAVYPTNGQDPELVARSHDPRRGGDYQTTARAALVKITVPLAEMRRLGE